jgi:hypothetical protein
MALKRHVSLDLETLDVKHSAAVVEVGAIVFTMDEDKTNSSHWRFLTITDSYLYNIPPRLFKGNSIVDTVSTKTIDWWETKSGRDLYNLPNNDSILTLPEHKERLTTDLANLNITGDYYSRGTFDIPILDTFLKDYKPKVEFRKANCVRTLDKVVKFPKLLNGHHALTDAMHNIHIIAAANRLTIRYNPECSHLETLCLLTTSTQSEIPKVPGLVTGGQLSLL